MTILDQNGNPIKTGKPAANWFQKHKKEITESYVDSAGRSVCTFQCGRVAMFFARDEHPKTIRLES